MDPVSDFLARHPRCNPDHVDEFAEATGMPYCHECHDWHLPEYEHSKEL